MSRPSNDPRVIHEPDSIGELSRWSPRNDEITTINLGRLDAKEPLTTVLPSDLAACYPNLTHLRLWRLDVRELPVLPEGLKWLEVRKCPNLTELLDLPTGVEVLVLEELPELSDVLLAGSCKALWDLSFKGCSALSEAAIQSVMRRAPNLRELDLSSTAIKDIRAWPSGLERIELNGCKELCGLPVGWPRPLRRLGLRGAKTLGLLPKFRSWPEYLDLAGTEGLKELPEPSQLRELPEPPKGRTLFLYGSGILVPPATEHGRSADENVAERTRKFFGDQELCGSGEVKRCKLLMLGNGSAGKTSLSLALVGDDPSKAEQLGSTHGVQFWDQPRSARLREGFDDVQVQIWDFGGQEIYHQTHQLFMSRASVFLVLWDPNQDGKQPRPTSEGYQDVWRRLRYWLDFVHLACPWKPRIAIVCSGDGRRRTEALEQQWRNQVGEQHSKECRCFYVDSWKRTGELTKLEEWLEVNIGAVVSSQGTAVPSYWEIAQDLVSGWIQEGAFNEMSREDFARHLQDAIEAERGRHEQLDAALRDGSFVLHNCPDVERAEDGMSQCLQG
ncbi:MAG: hypothetical protein H7A46_05370 [Verrucomicrobiales bacterium]|nr:hypothetical protein [Verrucomicrobiales bacterium]